MSVYLGDTGLVYLQRPTGVKYSEAITSLKVDSVNDKLLLDIGPTVFSTGDFIRFKEENNLAITFLPGDPTGAVDYYIHVDPVSGWRLYDDWASAMRGGDNYVDLETTTAFTLEVELIAEQEKKLAEVSSFSLSTSRESESVLSLGEDFRSVVPGEISGSGSVTCFWSFDPAGSVLEQARYCADFVIGTGDTQPVKLALVIVTRGVGSSTGDVQSETDRELFYLVNAHITSSAISFSVEQPVSAVLQFVTTGDIQLIYGDIQDYFV